MLALLAKRRELVDATYAKAMALGRPVKKGAGFGRIIIRIITALIFAIGWQQDLFCCREAQDLAFV